MARIRTFLAVEVADAVRRGVVALQHTLGRAAPGVKWVEEESLHLTLHFLGEIPELDVVGVCRAAAKVAGRVPPFSLDIKGVGCFPNARRPKILWAGVGDGGEQLKQLHDELEDPLLDIGCYRREDRDYTPHLTLGRLTQEDREEAWGPILAKHAEWSGGETQVREVLVMSSELRRDRPVYTVMSRARLAGVPTPPDDDEE